jgi:rhodanese-related sulfurtransferase
MSEELEHVSAEEAISLVAGSTVLLDVREGWEWDAGHAPTAIHIPLGELEGRMAELPRDETVLVICHSGARSLRAAGALQHEGFAVVNVVGGMMAWEGADGPVVRQESSPPGE